MKKLFFIALIALSLTSSAFALPIKKVNYRVLTTFQFNYPHITNVDWNVENTFAKATFILNDIKTEAFYNLNGELIGASHAISINDLPVSTKRSLAKKYSRFTIKETIQFEGIDETAYFISAEDEKQFVILKVTDEGIYVFKVTDKN